MNSTPMAVVVRALCNGLEEDPSNFTPKEIAPTLRKFADFSDEQWFLLRKMAHSIQSTVEGRAAGPRAALRQR